MGSVGNQQVPDNSALTSQPEVSSNSANPGNRHSQYPHVVLLGTLTEMHQCLVVKANPRIATTRVEQAKKSHYLSWRRYDELKASPWTKAEDDLLRDRYQQHNGDLNQRCSYVHACTSTCLKTLQATNQLALHTGRRKSRSRARKTT
jgi:hypothetical protein